MLVPSQAGTNAGTRTGSGLFRAVHILSVSLVVNGGGEIGCPRKVLFKVQARLGLFGYTAS